MSGLYKELQLLENILGGPNIARTKTSRASDKLIDQFSNRLAAFIWLLGQRRVTSDDKKRLFVIFYEYSASQYFLGQEYADKEAGEPKPVSVQDIKKIDNMAKGALTGFWEGLHREGITEFDGSIQSYDIEKLVQTHNDFDEAIQAEWKKSRGESLRDFLSALLPGFISITSYISADLGIRALNSGTLSNAKRVQFITRLDNSVCPICIPFHRATYNVDPNTGIVKDGPEIPVHPNCRCRYLLVGAPEDL